MDYYDALETRDPAAREAELFAALPGALAAAVADAPGWAEILAGVDLGSVTSRAALAGLPVTRKADLFARQARQPPFGGLVAEPTAALARVFTTPGPGYLAQGRAADGFGAARALHAAGLRPGELTVNAFGYHMTPGAFILESGLAALGCPVFAAGPASPAELVPHLSALGVTAYCGVPDHLNLVLDRAEESGVSLALARALVSGAALPGGLRERIQARGVRVAQAYATADLGVVAYETSAREGLVVNEGLILEIVRPGTGDPVPDGEVGEVVVTRLSRTLPLFRLATGDLSAVLPGQSPCGRTNTRIRGFLGRADQRTKVKGMFVDPAQVARVAAQHPGIARVRLLVARADHVDTMTLRYEGEADPAAVAASLRAATGLSGTAERVAAGTLPNDGKAIADERPQDG